MAELAGALKSPPPTEQQHRDEVAQITTKEAKEKKEEECEGNAQEMNYLNQIREIMQRGIERKDRTKTGTISVFGLQARYNIRDGVLPLLTTKRVAWKSVAQELLWFIRGETNSKALSSVGVKIWDANGSREFLDSLGHFDRPEGDLGPVYGFQWRHFGAEYLGTNVDYSGKGVDQLTEIIRQIREEPDSRRIVLCAWNPKDLPQMALPPCHVLCQFYVANGELSCQLYQRSGDMGLGVPFNIASYSLLTHMIAHVTGLKAGDFVHTLGDAHIYSNHKEQLLTQLERKPRPFPKVSFLMPDGKLISNIEDFTIESIHIEGYNPHDRIEMKMAV